jgi:4-hydroxybutyrate CoA-transferase
MTKSPTWMSAEDALAHVKPGMTIAFPHLSAEPGALTAALWTRAETVPDLTIVSGMLLTGYGFLTAPCAKNITFKTWFLPGTLLRKTAPDVKADYLPLTWAQTARYLMETPFDVGLIQVSPADADGYHSFGVCCTAVKGIAHSAKLLIAQVNPQMPRTLGDSRIHASQIDILVDGDAPLTEYPNRPLDEIDSEIGRVIAGLIPDGSSISLGVGGIPLAAANALIDKGAKDLRFINTFTDPSMALIQAGCATTEMPIAETGDIFGSKALYNWVADNPAIALADALTTHRAEDFVRRKTVMSVNSALEIDLLGQVNAETIGGKQAGSMGGLIDFAVGGQVEGGQFILGLRSQTNRGKARIVTKLDGDIVSLSRTFVETVVTEYGVANLRGKTVRERAMALADIAHPDDRAALSAAAEQL